MLQQNGSSHLFFNDTGAHVSPVGQADKLLKSGIRLCQLPGPFSHHEVGAGDRNHEIHPVTMIDVHDLGDGAQAMMWI